MASWARCRADVRQWPWLSQVAAQYWLDSGQAVPRDEAVELMSRLAWRGLAHFPMVHD